MRLAEHRLYAYQLRYAHPVRWSDIVEEAAPFVLLRLASDSGDVGAAEITVKPTWCGVTARSLIASIEDIFIPRLRTLDLGDPAKVRAALEIIPENQAAKTLIDNACWDLYAARHGRPLWQLWNGRRQIELSWAVTRQEPAKMAREAESMVSRHGFRTLKIKGGQGIERDSEAMHGVRSAVGAGVRLYVDANGAYSEDQTLRYADAMAAAGAALLEDPCPMSPDARFEELRQSSPLPILVDFGCTSLRDASLFLERGARALSIKPGRFGLSHSRAMQTHAQQAGCDGVAGLMGESAAGTWSALQFASTVTDPILPAELTWFLAMTEQIAAAPNIVGGMVELPDTPSVASLIDWSALDKAQRPAP